MLIESIKKEKKELYEKGIEEGVEKGIEKGVEKEKIENAKRMLAKNFTIELISEITGLSIKQLKSLINEI